MNATSQATRESNEPPRAAREISNFGPCEKEPGGFAGRRGLVVERRAETSRKGRRPDYASRPAGHSKRVESLTGDELDTRFDVLTKEIHDLTVQVEALQRIRLARRRCDGGLTGGRSLDDEKFIARQLVETARGEHGDPRIAADGHERTDAIRFDDAGEQTEVSVAAALPKAHLAEAWRELLVDCGTKNRVPTLKQVASYVIAAAVVLGLKPAAGKTDREIATELGWHKTDIARAIERFEDRTKLRRPHSKKRLSRVQNSKTILDVNSEREAA